MELFLTFIIIFIPIFISFICCRTREKDNIYFWFLFTFAFAHVFHLIIISLLLSKNFYKNTVIWKTDDYQFIHLLPINPIKNINIDINGETILEDFVDLKYTLKQTNIFNKKCLNNFFIKEDKCPITDIILTKFQSNDYSNYTVIKIKK